MRLKVTRNFLLKILLWVLAIFFVVLLFFSWDKIVSPAYPFFVSFFLAYLLNPLICKLELKGIKRPYGIAIIYCVLCILGLLICFYIIPVLVRDLGKLTGLLPEYNLRFNNTVQYLQEKYSRSEIPAGIRNAIDNNILKIQNYITLYLESVTSTILSYLSKAFSFALIPVLLYYFLKDYNSIVDKAGLLIPRKYRNQILRICSNIDEVFGSYVRSQIILSIIIAFMTSVVLYILKIDFALIIGLLNGITNIIPYFGPIIGAVPAVLIALLQSPAKAIYTAVAMIIIQQLESDIISPKITAGSVGLHPVVVILALIIGGEFFGITGMILGVPAAAALKIVYRDVMKDLF